MLGRRGEKDITVGGGRKGRAEISLPHVPLLPFPILSANITEALT